MDWQERAALVRTLRPSECVWGNVQAWEPPHRLLLAWHINADFQYDPNLLTEVEIRFLARASGGTQVEFEHRLLENLGPQGATVADMMNEGWGSVIAGFGEKADAT